MESINTSSAVTPKEIEQHEKKSTIEMEFVPYLIKKLKDRGESEEDVKEIENLLKNSSKISRYFLTAFIRRMVAEGLTAKEIKTSIDQENIIIIENIINEASKEGRSFLAEDIKQLISKGASTSKIRSIIDRRNNIFENAYSEVSRRYLKEYFDEPIPDEIFAKLLVKVQIVKGNKGIQGVTYTTTTTSDALKDFWENRNKYQIKLSKDEVCSLINSGCTLSDLEEILVLKNRLLHTEVLKESYDFKDILDLRNCFSKRLEEFTLYRLLIKSEKGIVTGAAATSKDIKTIIWMQNNYQNTLSAKEASNLVDAGASLATIKQILKIQNSFAYVLPIDIIKGLIRNGATTHDIRDITWMLNRYDKKLSENTLKKFIEYISQNKSITPDEIKRIIEMDNRFGGSLTKGVIDQTQKEENPQGLVEASYFQTMEKLIDAGATAQDLRDIKYHLRRKRNNGGAYTLEEIDDLLSSSSKPGVEPTLEEKQNNFQILMELIRENNEFDGKLLPEERAALVAAGLSPKKIQKIEGYLKEYKDVLTGYRDLVGDSLIPGPMFFYNMDHFGYLLKNDPEITFRRYEKGLKPARKIARAIMPLIRKFGPLFMKSDHILVDRNLIKAYSERRAKLEADLIKQLEAMGERNEENEEKIRELIASKMQIDLSTLEYEPAPELKLLDKPVIYAMMHAFKDDAISGVRFLQRIIVMLFGSLPQFFNTFDGTLAANIGVNLINRNSPSSREASVKKMEHAIDIGIDAWMAPEGVLNKTMHKLIEETYPGLYRTAKEKGCLVVPIIHYIFDPTQKIDKKANPIYTVIDDPIDFSNMTEAEGLECYRARVTSLYYPLMEMHGQTTRETLLNGYPDQVSAYEHIMQDYLKTIDRYDTESEKGLTCPSKATSPEEAFGAIAALHPNDDSNKIVTLVKKRKEEDFQHKC